MSKFHIVIEVPSRRTVEIYAANNREAKQKAKAFASRQFGIPRFTISVVSVEEQEIHYDEYWGAEFDGCFVEES